MQGMAAYDAGSPDRFSSVCYAVTTCPNGKAALEKLRDRSVHFDLVLSDVYMPGG